MASANMETSGLNRILEEYNWIQSNPLDDLKCLKLRRNPYEWVFGVRGARGTEFEGGIYHGRVKFPKSYPLEHPSFMFLTENGRFKTQTKIGLDWQPSWTVGDALLELIRLMPTYDGELGSVEYDKEERRALAIKSRVAAPNYGTSEHQQLFDEIHEYMLTKAPPVPVPQLSPCAVGTGLLCLQQQRYWEYISHHQFQRSRSFAFYE